MSRYSDYFNASTGEQASGMLVIKGGRYPPGFEFVTVFSHALRHLAQQPLTSTQWRVLMLLMASVEYGNFIRRTQRSISEELGISPPNISRAVKRLASLGLVIKSPHPLDQTETVRVSTDVLWKGSAKQWCAMRNRGEGQNLIAPPLRRSGKPKLNLGGAILRAENPAILSTALGGQEGLGLTSS